MARFCFGVWLGIGIRNLFIDDGRVGQAFGRGAFGGICHDDFYTVLCGAIWRTTRLAAFARVATIPSMDVGLLFIDCGVLYLCPDIVDDVCSRAFGLTRGIANWYGGSDFDVDVRLLVFERADYHDAVGGNGFGLGRHDFGGAGGHSKNHRASVVH